MKLTTSIGTIPMLDSPSVVAAVIAKILPPNSSFSIEAVPFAVKS